MLLMDKMILTGRFWEFVNEIIGIRNQELEDRFIQEVWLHRIFDMSYSEFVASVGATDPNTAQETMSDDAQVDIIAESRNMLEGFCPQ